MDSLVAGNLAVGSLAVDSPVADNLAAEVLARSRLLHSADHRAVAAHLPAAAEVVAAVPPVDLDLDRFDSADC